jgi:predicted metal-dependent enzyme (double-stranded beta helix superfamily)
MAMSGNEKLLGFVRAIAALCAAGRDEAATLRSASELMRALVARDDWLPDACAVPHPAYYQQHLLYGDPAERFSLVSFVWGPGQKTPVHDHTVWGVIGVLRGAEISQAYARSGTRYAAGEAHRLEPGQVECVSPTIGDVHRVANAYDDRVSVSIHLYGGNIGRIRRHVFDPETGAAKDFVSGYSNATVPNLWAVSSPG